MNEKAVDNQNARASQSEGVIANKTVAPHRMLVGNPDWYDIQSANQFSLLVNLGLREHHTLLDIGCGSLRAGRLLISYLLPGNYCGLELQQWLVQEGIEKEIGQSTIDLKKPTFNHDKDFTLTVFQQEFDFIIAHSIFTHTPEYELRRCLREAARVMKPTSIFAATYWPGSVSSTNKSWVIRAEFRTEHMQAMVEEAGLVFMPIEWPQLDLQSWFLILPKGHRVTLPDTNNLQRMVFLKEQLTITEEQLFSIRSHPWVRLGHKIRYTLVWFKLLKQLGRFRAGALTTFLVMRYDYIKKSIKKRIGGSQNNIDD